MIDITVNFTINLKQKTYDFGMVSFLIDTMDVNPSVKKYDLEYAPMPAQHYTCFPTQMHVHSHRKGFTGLGGFAYECICEGIMVSLNVN